MNMMFAKASIVSDNSASWNLWKWRQITTPLR